MNTTKQEKNPSMMMVQFDMESCEIHDIEHLNDCTEEEVAAKWLTRMEWNEIRNGYTSVVKLLLFANEEEELFDETDEQNTVALRRGLEPWIPQFADVKNEAIDHAVRAVLDEQELQYQDNIHDDDLLAEIYCNFLGNSTERAYRMALDDEEVANRIYDEDDDKEEEENSNNKSNVVLENQNSNNKNHKKHPTIKSSSPRRKRQYRSMIKQLKGTAKYVRL